jgi:phosphatidylserine/phosphatidylglycerophosphate/cardiolipin synthase-like enzyme
MIRMCDGRAVGRLLEGAIRDPDGVLAVVIASPFIDDDGIRLLRRLAAAGFKAGFGLRLATRPTMEDTIARATCECSSRIYSVEKLHSKQFAVLRTHGLDQMIVGSANLTAAGLGDNVELGVHVIGRTQAMRSLIRIACAWAMRSHSHLDNPNAVTRRTP